MKCWVIEHGMYGCATGCCGYWLTEEDGDERTLSSEWTFDHPDWDDDERASDRVLIEFARRTFKHIDADDSVRVGEWRSCEI